MDYYVNRAILGQRNRKGFDLALQLRDIGTPQHVAEQCLTEYQRRVPTDPAHPYTEAEALASVRSAYYKAPREPPRLRQEWHGASKYRQRVKDAIDTFNKNAERKRSR